MPFFKSYHGRQLRSLKADGEWYSKNLRATHKMSGPLRTYLAKRVDHVLPLAHSSPPEPAAPSLGSSIFFFFFFFFFGVLVLSLKT